MPQKNNKSKPVYPQTNGKIEIIRNGSGFVTINEFSKDIFIRADQIGTALNGDLVKIEITKIGKNNKRSEGKVLAVLTRKTIDFIGVLEVKQHVAFLIPDNRNMPVDIFIPLHLLNGGKDGEKAIVRIVEWNDKGKNPVGQVLKILNTEQPNDAAMQQILFEAGFPTEFGTEALAIADKISNEITPEEIAKRKDFRNVLTFTIDPEDAKDFDDAISFQKLKNGDLEIGVHIADVSHYLTPNNALDEEAAQRATSVYLPDRVNPMLPEHISNYLCSLRPNEEKLTFSCVFILNKDGKIKSHWIGKTIIKSDKRYTYEEAQAIIEGHDGEYKDEILQLNQLAEKFRNERFKNGAINFSSQEVRFKLDENAVPVGIVIKESKEAHKLIEEWMLLANRTVAAFASGIHFNGNPIPFPYRIHDAPDESKLQIFVQFAAKLGYQFQTQTPEKIAHSFNEMLTLAKGKPEQHLLEKLGIRTMSKAIYTIKNIGHYGLGFEDYCHFTSPIRRYPDVLVHRIIENELLGKSKPIKDLEAICRHCSDQERNAMEAERKANKYKQIEYMSTYLGSEFDALVSGVSAYGIWAETIEHKCEGNISFANLIDIDDFVFDEKNYCIKGQNTGLSIQMGDPIKIRVLATNLEKIQMDYELVGFEQNTPQVKSKKHKKDKQIKP